MLRLVPCLQRVANGRARGFEAEITVEHRGHEVDGLIRLDERGDVLFGMPLRFFMRFIAAADFMFSAASRHAAVGFLPFAFVAIAQ
jgi:hypothetical protein